MAEMSEIDRNYVGNYEQLLFHCPVVSLIKKFLGNHKVRYFYLRCTCIHGHCYHDVWLNDS